MITVALSYSLDGTQIVDLIRSEFKKNTSSCRLDDYPIPGKNGNPEFWRSLNFGLLNADVVLFICTESFLSDNQTQLTELESQNKQKYRIALIIPEEICTLPQLGIPSDIEFRLGHAADWVSKLHAYCRVVELVKQNGKSFKKERTNRFTRLATRFSSMLIAYLAIIVCALAVFFHSENVWGKSSAELILLFTAIIAVFSVVVVLYYTLNRMQRNIDREEQDVFGNDLDVSLSGGTQSISIQPSIISALQDTLIGGTSISHEILDSVFSLLKASKTEHESIPVQKVKSGDADTAQAIGESEYLPLGHLKMNWKQMKGYYDISKKQATTSFAWAIFICFLGIAIIVFAILSPLMPAFSSSSSLIPIIGSIAGAVVELFAGTILVVYIKSLSQMNLYHRALSEYQRYLSCVNLASLINNSDTQNQLYREIIMAEISRPVKEGLEIEQKSIHKT